MAATCLAVSSGQTAQSLPPGKGVAFAVGHTAGETSRGAARGLRFLMHGTRVASAGFPVDHRSLRPDGFNFKDLWGSRGQVIDVQSAGPGGVLLESTLQTTVGMSGGPLYSGDDPQALAAIGMIPGSRGNGIDTSAAVPNTQLLFTAGLIAQIRSSMARTPCG
jgi:hypothetical protein